MQSGSGIWQKLKGCKVQSACKLSWIQFGQLENSHLYWLKWNFNRTNCLYFFFGPFQEERSDSVIEEWICSVFLWHYLLSDLGMFSFRVRLECSLLESCCEKHSLGGVSLFPSEEIAGVFQMFLSKIWFLDCSLKCHSQWHIRAIETEYQNEEVLHVQEIRRQVRTLVIQICQRVVKPFSSLFALR